MPGGSFQLPATLQKRLKQSVYTALLIIIPAIIFSNHSLWTAFMWAFVLANTYNTIRITRKVPVRIEFNDTNLKLRFIFGRELAVRQADIVRIDTHSPGAVTLLTRNNGKISILPYFSDYPKLVDNLRLLTVSEN